MAYKFSLDKVSVTEFELSKSLSHIQVPVPFVPLFFAVSSSICDFSISLLFTHLEVPYILCSIIVDSSTVTYNLTILKLPFESVSVAHHQDTFSSLLSLFERSLVLEERIGICVTALSLSQFSHGVNISYVTVLCCSIFHTTVLDYHLLFTLGLLGLVLDWDIY